MKDYVCMSMSLIVQPEVLRKIASQSTRYQLVSSLMNKMHIHFQSIIGLVLAELWTNAM